MRRLRCALILTVGVLVACAPTHPEARHIVATTTTTAVVTTTTQTPAPAVSAVPRASRKTTRPRGSRSPGTVATSGSLLACIRSYEGSYTSNTGNGYFGAYQFNRATWRGAVGRAGYPEWAERLPSDAPAYVQDAAAAQLIRERGLQPWPTPNRRCR